MKVPSRAKHAGRARDEPALMGMPATPKTSLTDSGIPCSRPAKDPARAAASAASAIARPASSFQQT